MVEHHDDPRSDIAAETPISDTPAIDPVANQQAYLAARRDLDIRMREFRFRLEKITGIAGLLGGSVRWLFELIGILLNTRTAGAIALVLGGTLAFVWLKPQIEGMMAQRANPTEFVQLPPQAATSPGRRATRVILRVDDALVRYAALAAADDMQNVAPRFAGPNDRLAAALVNVFIAIDAGARVPRKDERGPYDQVQANTQIVWKTFEALRAPGDPATSQIRWEWYAERWEIDKDDFESTRDQLRTFLLNPELMEADWGWLRNARVYLRTKESVSPSINVDGIRTRMCRLTPPEGLVLKGEYFRKKRPEEKEGCNPKFDLSEVQ